MAGTGQVSKEMTTEEGLGLVAHSETCAGQRGQGSEDMAIEEGGDGQTEARRGWP